MGFLRKLFGRNGATTEERKPASAPAKQEQGGTATASEGEQTPLPESQPDGRQPSEQASRSTTAVEEAPTTPPGGYPAALVPGEPADEDDEDDKTHRLVAEALPAPALTGARSLAGWAARDIGRVRQINQDHVLSLVQNLPRGGGDTALGLFVVADGMGGHTGGEIASRLAVETILVSVLEQLVLPAMAEEDPATALQTLMITALQDANTRIWQTAEQQGTDMGTTCTAALFLGNGLYLSHVGDSRAYVLAAGQLQQLTNDHSAVGRLIELGQLTRDQASTHPLRNQLYRSVGQNADIQVDFLYHPIEGASHLLLCSDGLWGMVPDEEIAAIIEEAASPEAATRRLIARANMLGGEDNISAVVATLPFEGSAA